MTPPPPLAPAEKAELLKYARAVLHAFLFGEKEPQEPQSPRLQQPGACFVTLYAGGELRGCAGSLTTAEPLVRNAARNTENAAFRDPVLPPLSQMELKDVRIGVSVLSPLQEISGPEAFRPGTDGIVLRHQGRNAVFLPQIPREQHWTKEETLH